MILKPRLFRKPKKAAYGIPMPACLLPFYEGAGSRVNDLSGNGNAGTLGAGVTSPSWIAGKFGPALSFDGGDYIDVTGILAGTNHTIVLWVYSTTANVGYLIDSETGREALRYQYPGGDGPSYWDGAWHTSSVSMSPNKWQQLALVRKGTAGEIYIDGKSVFSDTGTAISLGGTTAIGSRFSKDTEYFTGKIDHIMIFDHALNASQIAQLYQDPFPWFKREPIELWLAAMAAGEPPVGIPILRRRRECA